MRTGEREADLPREHKAPALTLGIAILFAFIWLPVNEWLSGFAGKSGP